MTTQTVEPRRRNTDTTAATLERRRRKWERWAEEMRREGGYDITGGPQRPEGAER